MKGFFLVLTLGFALFSMFFGAGNLVYSLQLGFDAKADCMTAVAGFALTAVLVPMLGFFSMMLFKGDTKEFFSKIGKVPGFLLIVVTLGVMGPFGALPRCIALSYSATHDVFPKLSCGLFAALACLVIFISCVRENKIIPFLGKFLSPLKIATLGSIIIVGLFGEYSFAEPEKAGTHFSEGLVLGYQTLDLVAALFFSAFMYPVLSMHGGKEQGSTHLLTMKVIVVAASLLGIIYVGFCYLAGAYGIYLQEVPYELFLFKLSYHLLGEWSSRFTMLLVVLACLTTSIALSAIFSDFLRDEIFRKKVRYEYCLVITLAIAYFFATLEFNGIVQFLAPILMITYPALIVLAIANICNKLFNFQYVRSCFFIALAATIAFQL